MLYKGSLCMNIQDNFGPIRKGLLGFVVLKIIAGRKAYAADIIQELNKTEFTTQEGTLYPLLSRLRREGFVDYEWVESEAGPPRKYYILTKAGKKELENLEKYWNGLHLTIKKLGEK